MNGHKMQKLKNTKGNRKLLELDLIFNWLGNIIKPILAYSQDFLLESSTDYRIERA